MVPTPSFISSDRSETSRSSDLYSSSSWYFSDNGIGTSVDIETSAEDSNLEKQICDLHGLRRKLVDLENQKHVAVEQIQAEINSFDRRRLEAEKTVLLSTLKTKLLLADFRQKYQSPENKEFCNIGSVTISDVKLHCDTVSQSQRSRHYFLCALTSGCNLFLSQILEADPEGIVNFNIRHTFLNLPVDFEICIQIYILKVKKKSLLKRLSEKLFRRCNNNIQDNTNSHRESSFKFWKQTTINIANVNTTNEVFLEVTNSKLCKVMIDVIAKTDFSGFSHAGWMDFSRNGLFWNQRWCVLKGTQLNCFNYPVDNIFNKPLTVVDLRSCLSVKVVGCQESRSRVVILEMDEEIHNPFFFYLSTNSDKEFSQWKILEKLVPTLRYWKEANCIN